MKQFTLDLLRRQNLRASFLDRTIPLCDGTHCDVVSYGVDTPMRYSEFYALMADGRKVRLRDKRQFVAWQRGSKEQRFLFRGPQGRIEVLSGNTSARGALFRPQEIRKFIARDGGLLAVRRWGRVFAAPLAEAANDRTIDATMPHAPLSLEGMA